MYIVDLFSPYIEGREKAIEHNWQDLKNYENIEAMRTANNLSELDLLGQRAQFGGEMNIFQNNVDQSARANEVAEYAQPGMAAKANMGSLFALDQRGAYLNNRPMAQQAMNNAMAANLGNQNVGAVAMMGQNDYWNTDGRAYQAGQMRGSDSYNTAVSNNILASNAPTVARQTVSESNLNHRNNVLASNIGHQAGQYQQALMPSQYQLDQLNMANNQAQAAQYIPQQQQLQQQQVQMLQDQIMREITSLYKVLSVTQDPQSRQAIESNIMFLNNRLASLGVNIQPQQGGDPLLDNLIPSDRPLASPMPSQYPNSPFPV